MNPYKSEGILYKNTFGTKIAQQSKVEGYYY